MDMNRAEGPACVNAISSTTNSSFLQSKNLTKVYSVRPDTSDSLLELSTVIWHINGEHELGGGLEVLELCSLIPRSGIRIGVEVRSTCSIPSSLLLYMPSRLVEIILRDANSSQMSLSVRNLEFRSGNEFPNKGRDQKKWILSKRFVVLDNLNGRDGVSGDLKVIRYLKSVDIRVTAKGSDGSGIYPPLISISYGELKAKDLEMNRLIQQSLSVNYHVPGSIKKTFDAWLGAWSAVAAVVSAVRTWSNARRSGRKPADTATLFHFLSFCCGTLANGFFALTALAAIRAFTLFKGQGSLFIAAPGPELTYIVHSYLIVAFSLKLYEVLYVIWNQVNIDISFIDWERPRVKQSSTHVSAWRAYYVANIWNQIQTCRKTSFILQISVVILILKVGHAEEWASLSPQLTVRNSQAVSTHKVFTFAIDCLVYLAVYLAQWLFNLVIYERFVRNPINEFVDVCSMANISIFLLPLKNFGYYIHGRSAHGFSDTDIVTLKSQLRKEEEDMSCHRGLVPGSDHQTFQLLLPSAFRDIYRNMHIAQDVSTIEKQPPDKKMLDGDSHNYQGRSNRFLMAFIEHALKDLDYEMKEKTVIESLLDIEWFDFKTKGALYKDNGHSFDDVLFYGSEFVLFTSELVSFCCLHELLADLYLAALLTAAITMTITWCRIWAGKRNVERKTKIEQHFFM